MQNLKLQEHYEQMRHIHVKDVVYTCLLSCDLGGCSWCVWVFVVFVVFDKTRSDTCLNAHTGPNNFNKHIFLLSILIQRPHNCDPIRPNCNKHNCVIVVLDPLGTHNFGSLRLNCIKNNGFAHM